MPRQKTTELSLAAKIIRSRGKGPQIIAICFVKKTIGMLQVGMYSNPCDLVLTVMAIFIGFRSKVYFHIAQHRQPDSPWQVEVLPKLAEICSKKSVGSSQTLLSFSAQTLSSRPSLLQTLWYSKVLKVTDINMK